MAARFVQIALASAFVAALLGESLCRLSSAVLHELDMLQLDRVPTAAMCAIFVQVAQVTRTATAANVDHISEITLQLCR